MDWSIARCYWRRVAMSLAVARSGNAGGTLRLLRRRLGCLREAGVDSRGALAGDESALGCGAERGDAGGVVGRRMGAVEADEVQLARRLGAADGIVTSQEHHSR